MAMSARTSRHATGALLRAHLAAATRFRHRTRNCPICHRLLRLTLEDAEEREAVRSAHAPLDSGETADR